MSEAVTGDGLMPAEAMQPALGAIGIAAELAGRNAGLEIAAEASVVRANAQLVWRLGWMSV